MAISGKARFPQRTKLYVSVRLVVMTPYLAPYVSCSKDHLSRGSCSIHWPKVLIVLPSLLLVPGGSNLGKSQSPTGSSSTAIVPVANYAATASTCALTTASRAAFWSLTCLCVHTLSLPCIKSYFHSWFCLQSFLNIFMRFLFLNYEKILAPRWLMHQRLCKSYHGVCSLGPSCLKNHVQLSMLSLSTNANANGTT
ncbi:uncharacterized protein [Triticum aestivum]|uniref:uncharacterized protein n=1 Tax=Triticum aestivum TaxID=4565 RepID=UPI001D01D316|nr:uncharacterized protein LOC123185551 [Triticum aestivum]